jgi:hypothetical protein
MVKPILLVAVAMLISAAVSREAGAAGFCMLPNGSMGLQCVVSTSGQVYGCVADLKDCGALFPVVSVGDAALSFAINEQGVKAMEAAGHELTLRESGARSSLSASFHPDTGMSVTVRGWDPVVKANEIARKLSLPIEGYRLYIALPGYRVAVENDGVVEIAIKEQGVKRAQALGIEIRIGAGKFALEGAKGEAAKAYDAGAKDAGFLYQHNQTDLEFIRIR